MPHAQFKYSGMYAALNDVSKRDPEQQVPRAYTPSVRRSARRSTSSSLAGSAYSAAAAFAAGRSRQEATCDIDFGAYSAAAAFAAGRSRQEPRYPYDVFFSPVKPS